MSDKKYKLLWYDTRKVDGRKLYRIKAVRGFGGVRKGQLGGYIASEDNLSQNGECWVHKGACVMDEAWVRDRAQVENHAIVSDRAIIRDCARVIHFAKVSGEAYIEDSASVGGTAHICGEARIKDRAIVDDTYIDGQVEIGGDACITLVGTIGGRARIKDDAVISCNADLLVVEHSLSLDGFHDGDRNPLTFYTKYNPDGPAIMVQAGYYTLLTINEFRQSIISNEDISVEDKTATLNLIQYAEYTLKSRQVKGGN